MISRRPERLAEKIQIFRKLIFLMNISIRNIAERPGGPRAKIGTPRNGSQAGSMIWRYEKWSNQTISKTFLGHSGLVMPVPLRIPVSTCDWDLRCFGASPGHPQTPATRQGSKQLWFKSCIQKIEICTKNLQKCRNMK